jgi:hypothetical protein
MGLALSVGFLQELRENDPEAYEDFRQVNEALRRDGLPPHNEPDKIAPEHRISFEMFGYSGLHYLRRIAAHKHFIGSLPLPGDSKRVDDPLVSRLFPRRSRLPCYHLGPASRPISLSRPEAAHGGRSHEVRI